MQPVASATDAINSVEQCSGYFMDSPLAQLMWTRAISRPYNAHAARRRISFGTRL
jgi:hypothetical protein